MAKIKGNPQFFHTKLPPEPDAASSADSPSSSSPSSPVLNSLILDHAAEAQVLLCEIGQPKLAQAIAQAIASTQREHFSVAIVGEFSRGKSSFLNEFLGRPILPVGNLPTTALLTQIRGDSQEAIIPLHPSGKPGKPLPLHQDSWDKLVVSHQDSRQPEGSVLVCVNNPWLISTGIVLMDTPGAGDLEEARARVIGEALLGTDAAVIVVSATAALSMSERLFIEQRLIAHKVPFLMMVLTKLDLVPIDERGTVVRYVQQKLNQWGMNIPLFLPYQMEMPDSSHQDQMGMEPIRAQLKTWSQDPARKTLMGQWLAARILTQLQIALETLGEQKSLLLADEEKRRQMMEKKQADLSNASLAWEDLQNEFLSHCGECSRKLHEMADQYAINITEKLQHEASLTGSPQKWWTDSYPYRLKVELTNMSAALNKMVSSTIASDAAWLNHALENRFKTHFSGGKTAVSGHIVPDDLSGRRNVQFEDLNRERNTIRIGTAVLTVAGALVCAGLGVFPLVITMGVGTGSSIVTEKIFRDKIDKQHQAIREAIRVNVPELVEDATAESDKHLQAIYDDILKEARQQKESWLDAQQKAIAQACAPSNPEAADQLSDQMQKLEDCIRRTQRLV